jgi:transposase-like protein
MTNASLLERAHDGVVPENDPAPKPARRRFTAAYKLAILEEYAQTTDPGAKGALLRREGLYSSHIVEWRRAREVGALAELAPKVRRSKRSADEIEIERLR